MLPEGAIARFSLDAGEDRPALSLYADVQEDGTVLKTHTALERLRVARNLRHHEVTAFDAAFLAGSVPEAPYAEELHRLWCIANALEARRGKPSAAGDRADYNFIVHRHGDQERIEISQRPRGTPLDKTVAELMILANSTWGRLLDDNGLAAVYRAQTGGKVRMTTTPAPHQALGTSHYAWCTSPLRRYVDLVNQWQLLALVRGDAAPFQRDETLMATVYDFDATYSSYAEFQTRMERYWTLRWLEQEGIRVAAAEVVRDNLLRLERVPLYVRLPGMPALPPGERVQVAIEAIDLLEAEVRCSLVSAAADQKTP
jgi:exoribonuclease-2